MQNDTKYHYQELEIHYHILHEIDLCPHIDFEHAKILQIHVSNLETFLHSLE